MLNAFDVMASLLGSDFQNENMVGRSASVCLGVKWEAPTSVFSHVASDVSVSLVPSILRLRAHLLLRHKSEKFLQPGSLGPLFVSDTL